MANAKDCFTDFPVAMFKKVEAAAEKAAAEAGRKSPINADYIKVVQGLKVAQESKIKVFMETFVPQTLQEKITDAVSEHQTAEEQAAHARAAYAELKKNPDAPTTALATAEAAMNSANKRAEKAAQKVDALHEQDATNTAVSIAKMKAQQAIESTNEKYEGYVERPVTEVEQKQLIEAVESAKSEEDYQKAWDNIVEYYYEASDDTPILDAYFEANKDVETTKQFSEAERRYNAKLTEGVNGLEMGRSKKGSTGTIDQDTINALQAALSTGNFREGPSAGNMSVEEVETAVAAALKGVANPPEVVVFPDTVGLNIRQTGSVPKGVTLPNGMIFIFANGANSPLDVAQTVFHEMFHRGMKVHFKDNAEYIKTMQELEKSDPVLAQKAQEWKRSNDGKTVFAQLSKNGPLDAENMENYNAMAVEEGLARMAEDSASPSRMRRLLDILARLADAVGIPKIGAFLRNAGRSKAEQFVREVSAKAGGKVNMNTTALFFRTEEELSAQERATNTPPEFVKKWSRTKMGRMIRDIAAGWRGKPGLLGFLTLDQIKDRFTNYPSVSAAVNKWLYMGQRANQIMNIPAHLSQQWAALARRDKAMIAKTEKLFIDATLGEIWVNDPKLEPSKDPRNAHIDFQDAEKAKLAAELRTAYMALPKEYRTLYDNVTAELQSQFHAKQDAILGHVVDMFVGDLRGVMTREQMIQYAKMTPLERVDARAAAMEGINSRQRIAMQKFSAAVSTTYTPPAQVPGPYFPLQRKGDHIVVFKSGNYDALQKKLDEARAKLNDLMEQEVPNEEAEAAALSKQIEAARKEVRTARAEIDEAKANASDYKVTFFDSLSEARDFADDLRSANPNHNISVVRRQEFQSRSDDIPAGFLNKLTDKLNNEMPPEIAKGVSNAVRDLIIKNLPERSTFKSELKRMKVDGVKPEDAMSSFAAASHKNAWAISRLENVGELTKALQAAHSSMDMDERAVGNELMKRYSQSLAYNEKNSLIDMASNLSYLSHLGFSVGYYFQNMLQPWMVSMPVMAGRHGFAETNKQLGRATADVVRAMKQTMNLRDAMDTVDMQLNLDSFSPEEQLLIKQLTDEGRINITVRADLGVSQSSETNAAKHLLQRASELSAWPAHQVEIVNRVATALAAYRMEKSKPGTSYQQALAYADKVIVQTHVDYSMENAPRFMNPNAMGGLGRLAFQFKRYQQAMVFLWTKTLMDAVRQGGWNEHTKALTYLTGVNFAMAGAAGLPVAGPIGLLAWAAAKGFDDDGEKSDYLEMLRAGVRSVVGDTATDLLTKGAPAALGVDMSARIGSGSIFSPMYRMPSGNTGQEWMGGVAATLFGAAGGTAANMADAIIVAKDNPTLALQKMLPNGIGSFIAAVDRTGRGMTDRKGNQLIGSDEFGVTEFLAKGLNLGESTKVTNMYDARSAIMEDDQARQGYRSRLLRNITRARAEGDGETAAEVQAKIDTFNKQYPAVAIKGRDILSYSKAERQRQKDMVDGIRITKRNADIAAEYGYSK